MLRMLWYWGGEDMKLGIVLKQITLAILRQRMQGIYNSNFMQVPNIDMEVRNGIRILTNKNVVIGSHRYMDGYFANDKL
jgi:hypothetical protein